MLMPRLGDAVYYFSNGVTNEPKAAMVVGIIGNGMLDLAVWDSNQWLSKKRLLHKESPQLKANPQIAAQYGCWDVRESEKENLAKQQREIDRRKQVAEDAELARLEASEKQSKQLVKV